jgi:hypothetical protein
MFALQGKTELTAEGVGDAPGQWPRFRWQEPGAEDFEMSLINP